MNIAPSDAGTSSFVTCYAATPVVFLRPQSFFLRPQLSARVPVPIHELFEVARGSMIYGWYYYPLVTLAMEQLFRVMETAIVERCRQAAIPVTNTNSKGVEWAVSCSQLIDQLAKQNLITAVDAKRFHAARSIRNARSHPDGLMIVQPGDGCRTVETACEPDPISLSGLATNSTSTN